MNGKARGVLVTRPLAAARETAAKLVARRYYPVLAPVLEIIPRAVALPPPETVQAVLASSRHAVEHLPAAHRELRLLAVGDATAARARAAGHKAVWSAAGDGKALAALAGRICDPEGEPLLLALGRGQGARLMAALAVQGFRMLCCEIYEAAPMTELPEVALRALAGDSLGGESLDAALFFSAETARAFGALAQTSGLLGRLGGVTALAIGAEAAAPLSVLPWRAVRVADQPNQEALLALLP